MLTDSKHIKIVDYDYSLPEERIAKHPIAQRDRSKLLVYRKGEITHDSFRNLPNYLPKGALMVFNNTRVIQARMHFRKETGALIEIFLMEPVRPADYERVFQSNGQCSWLCMVGNLKKWKDGRLERIVDIKGASAVLSASINGTSGSMQSIDFEWDGRFSFAEVLEAVGELPIPPYLNRETQESDKTDYQTVYSKINGSVAAPTAGLHFSSEVLDALDSRGIEREELTLHVGAGTFKPVKSAEISGHQMHSEYVVVRRHTLERLIAHQSHAIAVGTTSVRTLESLYYMGVKLEINPDTTQHNLHVSQWEPYDLEHNEAGLVVVRNRAVSVEKSLRNLLNCLERDGSEAMHSSTQIIIAPGYRYKIVDMLVTNFHQPKSTLLLLVSAFVKGDWRQIYNYALRHDFRFLSYGDSSLLIP